jgi:pSer/pThr/pTyr-binding forkhead associated (FHA) protein
MATLTLKFDERVLQSYGIETALTIGRLPDNAIVIDNPAVSGHHARIFREEDAFVIEDLRSKNGTYVNNKHVVREALKHGDVVLVGKHTLVFDSRGVAAPAANQRVAPTPGPTTYLDTKQHRAMLARLRDERAAREDGVSQPGGTADLSASARGTLRVLAGRARRQRAR